MPYSHITITSHIPKLRRRCCFFLSCLTLAFLITMAERTLRQEALAARIAPQILRFHILAESDAPEDQQVKLEIRSLLLDYLKANLPADAGKKDTAAYLEANREKIENMIDKYLEKHRFPYRASLSLTNCYFPTRTYGGLTFPCGYYDAARITLGSGKGHNWWCVLYPQFCFADAVCTGVPPETLELLRQKIDQEDFLSLQNTRPDLKIGFRLLPGLSF